jgi:hypothetical protein
MQSIPKRLGYLTQPPLHSSLWGSELIVPRTGCFPRRTVFRTSLSPLGKRRSDQTPMLALHPHKLRHRRLHAQLVGLGSEDPSDNGLDEPLEAFTSKPPYGKRLDALVLRTFALWNVILAQHS